MRNACGHGSSALLCLALLAAVPAASEGAPLGIDAVHSEAGSAIEVPGGIGNVEAGLEKRALGAAPGDQLALGRLSEVVASVPEPAQETSRRPGAGGPAEIVYLGHSGWAVRTPRRWLVFDYVPGLVPGNEAAFAEVWASELPLVVFVTHRHADHEAPGFLGWPEQREATTLVVGWEIEAGAVGLPPRSRGEVGELQVTTTASTDLGVGFLVEADGLVVYHAGDHARWSEGEDTAFREEILWLRRDAPPVDVAFLPVAMGASCRMTGSLRLGAYWAVDALRPAVAVPMHVRCPESSVYEEWVDGAPEELPGTLLAPAAVGFRFRYSEGEASGGAPRSAPRSPLPPPQRPR